MDLENSDGSREEETADETIEELCNRYNVSLQIFENNWSARTTLPVSEAQEILQLYGAVSQENDGIDIYNTYSSLAGSFIKKVYQQLPQTTVEIGDKPQPDNIKALSFLGEEMGANEALNHKIFHELAHVAIFYEMIDALEEIHPKAGLDDSVKYYEALTKTFRDSSRPLSLLKDIKTTDGPPFYSQQELFFEDLAEALATRMSGDKAWEKYTAYIADSALDENYTRDFITIVNKIFSRTKSQGGI